MSKAGVPTAWEAWAERQEEAGKGGRCCMPGLGISWVTCLQKLLVAPSFSQERGPRPGERLARRGSGRKERGETASVGPGSLPDSAPCRQPLAPCRGSPEQVLACPGPAVGS